MGLSNVIAPWSYVALQGVHGWGHHLCAAGPLSQQHRTTQKKGRSYS